MNETRKTQQKMQKKIAKMKNKKIPGVTV